MQIHINHLLDKTSDYIGSFDINIAPNIGDLAKIKDPNGYVVDGKVVSKVWDFARENPVLKIEVSPL